MTTTPETAPTPNQNPVPPDTRPIADMPFEGGDATRALLTRCGITEAREIEALGCTGATKHGLNLDEIRNLRLGLAGGGVGLPCFVDSNRYCLAHNTIGGLQHEQLQRHPEFVEQISRPLTRKEAGHVAFTEAVRHSTDASAGVGDRIASGAGMLNGYGEMPKGTEMVEEEPSSRDELHEQMMGGTRPPVLPLGHPFTCPEHTSLVWTCRFCVAHAVANGELEPVFAVHRPEGEEPGDATLGILGNELVDTIEKLDAAGANEIEIYVLVKTMKRRLG